MLATIPSATLIGVDGLPVSVEVHVAGGLPTFTVVGLPDASCREARDRVRAAISSSGLCWPQKRITVNLAPSGLRKVGAGLDLPIAVALLVADDQLPAEAVADCAFLGELGLDGSIRPVPGTLALVDAAVAHAAVVPAVSVAEAELVRRLRVWPATTLRAVVAALRGDEGWPDVRPEPRRSRSSIGATADIALAGTGSVPEFGLREPCPPPGTFPSWGTPIARSAIARSAR